MKDVTIEDIMKEEITFETARDNITELNRRIEETKTKYDQQKDMVDRFFEEKWHKAPVKTDALWNRRNKLEDTLYELKDELQEYEEKKAYNERIKEDTETFLKEARKIENGWTKEEINEHIKFLEDQIVYWKNLGDYWNEKSRQEGVAEIIEDINKKLNKSIEWKGKLEERLANMQKESIEPTEEVPPEVAEDMQKEPKEPTEETPTEVAEAMEKEPKEPKEETPPEVAEDMQKEPKEPTEEEPTEVAEKMEEEPSKKIPEEGAEIFPFNASYHKRSPHNTSKGKNAMVIDGTGQFKVLHYSEDTQNTSVEGEKTIHITVESPEQPTKLLHSTSDGRKAEEGSLGDFEGERPDIGAGNSEKKMPDPAEFLKEASENTRNPQAYPIKKKWTQILKDKINEIIKSGKDAIDRFFNR